LGEKERLHLLEREKSARAEAEEANRAKDFFLAILSHELRTPLTAIFTWAQLLSSGRLDPQKTTFAAKKIEESAFAQKRIIDDLLDVSRIITGKLSLQLGFVDVTPILIQAVDVLRPSATEKRVSIELSISSEGKKIRADSVRVHQIVTNLLNNALKFTPSGGKIGVVLEENASENQIQIKVSDSGIGIRPDLLPHIFSPFFQGDSRSIRVHGGLGLGLAIVHHLTQMMNGSVNAKSQGIGKGAEFSIHFPIAEEQGIESGIAVRTDSAQVQGSLEKMRILLVDDDERTRDSLRAGLEVSQASVETASSVQEALQILSRETPDVLISDIAMPFQDGYDLIQKIRSSKQQHPRKDLPAVALTAYADAETILRAQNAGYNACLTKPVLLRDLVAKLFEVKKA
jgi:CheY-like chemotaxis protein/nitrogen-specific signal transduction histidine kinase